MKLHRLILSNYRGIAHRDIEFPDSGVVVISGANEIGKSSMIEALDLLLESKDRSTKKDVKQVKPTHTDEGAEVTAEISTGPYRFTYFKRFHKRPVTELTITAPNREQWTGDEAHDRVRAMLTETVDVRLWEAQRVLQSASTAPVDLSGSDALSRALDVAAGQAVALSGSEPLLVDRVEDEFRQYFTATGRPTGEWAAAMKRREDAEAEVAVCEAAVAEVNDAVAAHDQLTAGLAALALERSAAAQRLESAQATSSAVEKLIESLERARVVSTAAASTHDALLATLEERRRLRAEVDSDTAAIGELDVAVAHAEQEEAAAREVHVAAEATANAAAADVESRQAEVDAARGVLEQVAQCDEADRLAARLAKIDSADRRLRDLDRGLTEIRLSDLSMRLIEAASAAVDVASAAAEAASARIEVVAATQLEITVGGEPMSLHPGATWSTSATAPTDVEVPGVLTVRVVPGTPAADTGAELDTKRQVLATVLEDARVADVEAARELDRRRRDLAASRDTVRATRDALAADDDVESLREHLNRLRDDLPCDLGSASDARAALVTASSVYREARATARALHESANAASTEAAEKSTRATVLRSNLDSARARVVIAADRLASQRSTATDDDVVLRTEAAAGRVREAAARVCELEAELAGAEPSAVAAELEDASRNADALGRQDADLGRQLVATKAKLGVYGSEGRRGRLDAAQLEHRHAEADWARLRRRAGAADLLRSVMSRHREDARQRYVEPFRVEVERLGRIVFGDDFEVGIDAALSIRSRTLDGRTVPYESLSGGAKEQLGIVARLAGAALVAKEDGVPVVIDDALGFTDAERLTRMAEVFDAVGGHGQVIVLTCSPERYADVADARRIELTA